jgi:hypothetical protein
VALTSLGMTGKRRVQDKIFCLGKNQANGISEIYTDVFQPLLNVEWTTATESSELFPEFFPATQQ